MTRDFAEKFNRSLELAGVAFSFEEAHLLVMSLLKDPTSWFRAEYLGWAHPISIEAMALLNQTDVLIGRWMKNPQPLPRPWDRARKRPGKRLSRSEVLAVLRPGKPVD